MWKKSMIRHQLLLRAIVVDVVIILLTMVGLLPMISSANTNLKKIETRTKDQEALVNKVAILSKIDQSVLQERTQIIKLALPEKKDVVAYLASIDGLSRELGLSFGGITLSPGDVSETGKGKDAKDGVKTRTPFQVLDTEVKIVGSREGIYSFLRLVEQALPLMQVADVKVTSSGVDNFTMSLSLGMLWAPYIENNLKGVVTLFNEKEESYFQKLLTYKRYYLQLGEQDFGVGKAGKTDLFAVEE